MVKSIIPANTAAGGYYELCQTLIALAHLQKQYQLTEEEKEKSAAKIGECIAYLHSSYMRGIKDLKDDYKINLPEIIFKPAIIKLEEGKPDEALDEIKKARKEIMSKIETLPISMLWRGLEDFLP